MTLFFGHHSDSENDELAIFWRLSLIAHIRVTIQKERALVAIVAKICEFAIFYVLLTYAPHRIALIISRRLCGHPVLFFEGANILIV